MTCSCEDIKGLLNQAIPKIENQTQIINSLQEEVNNLKQEIINLKSQSGNPDCLMRSEFLALVSEFKNDIVSILMGANTWDEIPITINLADYIKVQ